VLAAAQIKKKDAGGWKADMHHPIDLYTALVYSYIARRAMCLSLYKTCTQRRDESKGGLVAGYI
jgi:hypothetical protein